MENLAREKRRVAASSVLVAAFLTVIEFVVGFLTGSLGILAAAAHSLLDFGAAVVTYFAVTIADKPPDKEHHYGHGKIESFSALIETILLFATCGYIIYEAVRKLISGIYEIDLSIWGYLVMIIAIPVGIGRAVALKRVAKKSHSQALEADALHFLTDVWGSVVVLVGLIFAKFGFPQADPIAALIVAVLVIYASVNLAKRTFDILTDKAPEGVLTSLIEKVTNVDGVLDVKSMRVRRAGPKTFVDTTVSVDKTLPFDEAHNILDKVEETLDEVIPNSDVVVHPDPGKPPDGDISDYITEISDRYGVGALDIKVSHRKKGILVEFDISCDPNLTIHDIHRILHNLESDIREKFTRVTYVDIDLSHFTKTEGTYLKIEGIHNPLEDRIMKIIGVIPGIDDCRNLILTERNELLDVDIFCHFDGNLSLDKTNEIIAYVSSLIKSEIEGIGVIRIFAEPD
ncbi:MAG: cation diffusion facilitator family transporter [candidate division Zixibacteria bacterium]|nr:cation diffusion facilitator family transporter [candidate division Zixibacteria bacterium]